jgi:hypothetical protein
MWMGVQHAAVWGILAGVFNSIPYFGPVIVSGGLLVVGFAQGGDLAQALLMSGIALLITSRRVSIFDIVGNLLLFVPLGASIALHAQRSALRRTAAVAFACSLFGQLSQIYSRYRYPTTQDMLLNVIGRWSRRTRWTT